MRSSGRTTLAAVTITPNNWTWNGANLDSARRLSFLADRPSVWQASLTDETATLAHLTSLLSADERLRLARFQLRADQQRFLVGRGLLRSFVGTYMDVSAERVEFKHGRFGKPAVVVHAGAPALQFNVAHSGELVLLAFHPVQDVGVDVEAVRPDVDWEAIARRMFPAREYRRLLDLKPEEGLTAFFQTWTRHEAGLKAAGRGLGEHPEVIPDSGLALFDLNLPEGYCGAAACLR